MDNNYKDIKLTGCKNGRLRRIVNSMLASANTDEKVKFDIANHISDVRCEHLDKLSIDSQILIVSKCGELISLIRNPSVVVQIAAIDNNGFAIQYIKHPTETVKLHAVVKSGMALECIKNPTDIMIETAVKRNGFAIMFVKNPSLNLQLLAVQYNPLSLRFIKNPDLKTVELANEVKESKKEIFEFSKLKVYGDISYIVNMKKSLSR